MSQQVSIAMKGTGKTQKLTRKTRVQQLAFVTYAYFYWHMHNFGHSYIDLIFSL